MEELVIMKENKVVTTSLKVAESFGKKHRNVMQTIRNLIAENPAVKKMFVESTYINSRGQEWPMYYINRDGFTFLVMGFTGNKALEFKLKYIKAFNKMEDFIKKQPQFAIPQTFGEALQLAADQQKLIEKQKPKVEYYDEQMRNPGLMTVTEIAKDFGLSAAKLNQFLAKNISNINKVSTGLCIKNMQIQDLPNMKCLPMQNIRFTVKNKKYTTI